MTMSKQALVERLESELELIIKSRTRTDEPERNRERRTAYLQGWTLATHAVTAHEDHPEDLSRQSQQTGEPWNRSMSYDQQRGYEECINAAADVQWQYHLEKSPEDALPANLERRRNATLTRFAGNPGEGRTETADIGYMPESAAGCRRMLERISNEQRHNAIAAQVKTETWRQKLAYPECAENSHQTWLRVAMEELGECAKSMNLDGMTQAEFKKLEREIIQTAATCINWIQTRLRGNLSDMNKVR